MKPLKLSSWHGLALAVVFFALWVAFAHRPATDTFLRLARPRFVAAPDEPSPDTPRAAFRRAVTDPNGPPVHVRRIPFSPVIVMGPLDADGKIDPKQSQVTGIGTRTLVESYYAPDGSLKFRPAPAEGGRP